MEGPGNSTGTFSTWGSYAAPRERDFGRLWPARFRRLMLPKSEFLAAAFFAGLRTAFWRGVAR